jgi:hypothetical protein
VVFNINKAGVIDLIRQHSLPCLHTDPPKLEKMITTKSHKIVQAVAAFRAQKIHIFEIKDKALVFVIGANLRKDFASQFSNQKKNPKQGQRSNTKKSCNTIHDQLRN